MTLAWFWGLVGMPPSSCLPRNKEKNDHMWGCYAGYNTHRIECKRKLDLSSERRKLRDLACARERWASSGFLSMCRSTFATCCRMRLLLVPLIAHTAKASPNYVGSPSRGASGMRCNVRTGRLTSEFSNFEAVIPICHRTQHARPASQ
jgi:hypothetical protein